MKTIDIFNVNPDKGLSSSKVHEQIKNDNKNSEPKPLTKSIWQILFQNIFTLFNGINLVLGFLVFLTGSYINMLFLLIAAVNTIIGSFQEIRAKLSIDKMAILTQNKVLVIRNGQPVKIDPKNIVLGDIIVLNRGDQVPVDGVVKDTGGIEVDESQITGESNPIAKKDGDSLISGSYLVSGKAKLLATKVGPDTFVNSLAKKAKSSDLKKSRLINLINKIIKILTIIIIPLGILLFTSRVLRGVSVDAAILGTVASMIGMIPEGLVLLTSVTLAVSAYHLTRQKVLTRDLNSIETLARVDTICLDKTGTITNGDLKLEKIIPETKQIDADQLKKIVGSLIYDIDDNNETATAIANRIKDHPYPAQKIVPFSSARKWSGVDFGAPGKFVLGAPNFACKLTQDQQEQVDDYTEQGLRVLALAEVSDLDSSGLKNPRLIGLVLISDVIRPEAHDTLNYFVDQGVSLKIISGDDPKTVANIAKRVGMAGWNRYVDMNNVPESANYQELVKKYNVFGRVKPEQKEHLIKALQKNGHTVAMTGDGVNDLLALKAANCGIAIGAGSESVKSIADFVLINSNFSALIGVLKEGRRVINNIDNVASLYLIKTIFSVILSVIFLFLARNYPFLPIQLSPINTLMVGVPSFFLALQPNFAPIQDKFAKNIYEISFPAAFCVVMYVLLIGTFGSWLGVSNVDIASLNVLLTGIVCWLALVILSRPFNRFKALLVSLSIILFLSCFIFLGKIFVLVSILTFTVGVIGLLICLTVDPAFLIMQKICENFLKMFHKLREKR